MVTPILASSEKLWHGCGLCDVAKAYLYNPFLKFSKPSAFNNPSTIGKNNNRYILADNEGIMVNK